MTIILLLGKVFLQDSLKGYFQEVAEGFETKWERTKCTGNDSEKILTGYDHWYLAEYWFWWISLRNLFQRGKRTLFKAYPGPSETKSKV